MKTTKLPELVLTLLGLTALCAYVLACTSFSPDDSQVLLPAFEGKTGDIGASLYNRQTKQLEPIFVVSRFQEPGGGERQPVFLRPQWMPDGKRILVAWPGYSDNEDDVMNVALLSQGSKAPTRFLAIPGIEDARQHLMPPLAVTGNRLYLPGSPNLVIRINLETGESATNTVNVTETVLLPSPAGDVIYYFGKSAESGLVVGRLDPDALTTSVLWKIPAESAGDKFTFAVSSDGKRFALLQLKRDKIQLQLYKGPERDKTLTIPLGDENFSIGIPSFAPGQDVIYASYASEKGGSKVIYGLLEISLQDGSMRRQPLARGPGEKDEGGLASFTANISHDGKTAALCSTYLAADPERELKSEDCALFLVDLSKPDRPVTKVPLPLPGKKPKAEKKD
jgi:hypothetical protein